MDLAERQERGELDHSLDLSLEQNWQHEDVARRCFTKARRDPDVVVGNTREKYRLLLERRLSNKSLAKMEAVCNMLPFLVRVARDELERRRAFVLHYVERAVVRRHQRRELRHDEAGHGFEILLPLHHSRELREIRLQPVLLVVLFGSVLQVRDHLVEVVLELVELALRLHRDLPREVAPRHRSRDLGNCSHLKRETVCHRVHVVGERSPRSRCARHFCLATQLPFCAYFLCHACHFVCEHSQRVHHRVDRVLELEDLASHFDSDLL